MTQLVLALKLVALVFAALAANINPPASVPIFLATTAGCSTDMRKARAWRIAFNVFLILVVSMFVGSYILDFFGLSLPFVQVACRWEAGS
jgi:multiple antibiotic resistance protein